MSKTGKESVPFARVADAFGVRGQIKVQSFTEKPQNLLSYTRWVLDHGTNGQKEFSVTSGQLHGKYLTVKLDGVDTRDQALELKGSDILISESNLPELPEGDYYHFQLSGLEVIDVDGTNYGRVEEVMQTGANDVLVVKGSDTHLVPYIPEVVLEVDLNAGKIRVDWFEKI